jgi:hypothetical protein
MKLSPLAMGITIGLLLAGALLLVGLVAMVAPGYGQPALNGIASVYPGYDNSGTLGDLLIGALYITADGFFGGLVLVWLYNCVAGFITSPEASRRDEQGAGSAEQAADPGELSADAGEQAAGAGEQAAGAG